MVQDLRLAGHAHDVQVPRRSILQSIIQSRFIGDAVGLSVTVTFVALVFWAWLLGPLGAILAIPLTLLSKALLVDIDPQARWADALQRASVKEPDPAEPPRVKKPRRRHDHRADPVDGTDGQIAEQPVCGAPVVP